MKEATIFTTLAIFASLGAYLVHQLDIFKPQIIKDEGCEKIMGVLGAEDQTKWNDKAVLMGRTNRINWLRRKLEHIDEGAIFVMHGFKTGQKSGFKESLKLEKLPIENWPKDIEFQPLGLFVHHQDETLYVINHALRQGGERIEVFHVVSDNGIPVKLVYKHSITSENLNELAYGVLNSLTVISPNKFYITKFMDQPLGSYGSKIINFINEHLFAALLWPKTYVLYCEYDPVTNDLKCTKAAEGFYMANGITHNKDFSEIYVADSIGRTVTVFSRNAQTNILTKQSVIYLEHAIDNIKYDDLTGKIYGGTINKGIAHLKLKKYHPQEVSDDYGGVVELEKQKNEWKIRQLVVTQKLPGIGNGMKMLDQLLMGSWGYEGVLVCPIDESIAQETADQQKYDL